MKRLTVLYDPRCAFCTRTMQWLKSEPKFIAMEFVSVGSDAALERFPTLNHAATLKELTVIDDEGRVYYGDRAYIMCLYALRNYREWAARLAAPALWPMVKKALGVLTQKRHDISRLFITRNGKTQIRQG